MTLSRSLYLILSFFLGITVSSCHSKSEDKPEAEDGFENVYTKDGVLLQKVKHINGDTDRIVRDYYKNGQMFQEIHYVNYKKHGVVKQFYEDGKPYMIIPYDSGKRNGVEMKYRKDGTLAYEAPYFKDKPCTGLKEYLLDGSLKNKYPAVIITPIDKMMTDEMYILQLTLNDDTKSVEYFEGKLTDGLYIGDDVDRISSEQKGVGKWMQFVPEGGFYMKQLDFIAKIKTPQDNYYLKQAHYNLVAENR